MADDAAHDEIVTQMGLMLTQMKGLHGTLEQVAQATVRYAGFAFAEAFTPGGRFGAPPMRGGALLVHVNNLRDLVASSGIAGFFEGLLGGIGRFFGGLFGGLIGGTIAGVALPVMIWKIESIVSKLQNILERLGIGKDKPAAAGTGATTPTDAAAETAARSQPTASVAGEPLTDQIGEFREILSLLTGLFEAAGSGGSGGGGSPAPERVQASLTPQHERWMAMLRSVENVVGGVTRIINGLIILVPMIVGSLALLFSKLDTFKLAVVEILQFLVRNVLLLRGVVLVTVFDLLGVVARLAAGLAQIIGEMLQGILTSLFDIAGTVLEGALAVFQFLAGGLQRVVNGMLRWLVDTLFITLARFSDLRVFRLITHLIQVMPAVLPPLYELLRNKGTTASGAPVSAPLTPTQLADLSAAAALPLPPPVTPSTALPSSLLPAMPDPAALAAPPAALATLRTQMNDLRTGLLAGVSALTGSVATGFAALSARFDSMISTELDRSRSDYAANLEAVRARSSEFATAFAEAERAVRERPETGLEAIARAYETWLSGDGLRTLLDQITQQFSSTPATAGDSIPGRIVGEAVDRPRASIEIQEVIIDLTAASPGGGDGGVGPLPSPELMYAQLLQYQRELAQRGSDDPMLLPA
ncbi:hypothetical protein [Lysobacter silvisoli]|uniref:Uncharacterized protein n=1 Tax=Lysobacter silvisoli TaxID=2293254 RepID=A0A371K614_9GAMM|nr:hypothetical protein [Lysobacter silvisoli]RDZ29292.1 hypothetical protein DX914_09465 [Lysobacter silvisoli]